MEDGIKTIIGDYDTEKGWRAQFICLDVLTTQ